jgi:NitT/TauT family transport system permease protein
VIDVKLEVPALQSDTVQMLKTAPRIAFYQEPRMLKLASVLVLIGGWQIAAILAGPLALPTPIATVKALYYTYAHDNLLSATLNTAWVFLVGFLIAAVSGVIIGLLTGYFTALGSLLDVVLDVFIAIPVVALIPLVVTWRGLTTPTQLIIVFLSTFFPIVINTQTGVHTLNRTLRAVGVVFAGDRLHNFTTIVFPAAIPSIAAGIRVGVGRAIIGVFVAELFTAASGLGERMQYYSTYFQTDRYFAALVSFVVIAMLASLFSGGATRRWTRAQVRTGVNND